MTELKEKIAACCRILYVEGQADMNLGHVSARLPGGQTIWIKPRGLGLEEVFPGDLIELDLEGKKLDGASGPPGEWPLHTEIFRARNDVNCVVHVHPLWTVIFGIVGQPFQAVNQDGVVFHRGLRVFTGTAELVTTREQGARLAADLGDGNAILLPNHGVTLAASSVEEGLVVALNLEKALQAQLLAASVGGARNIIAASLSKQMGESLLSNRKRTQDIFAYYVRKADRTLSSPDRRS